MRYTFTPGTVRTADLVCEEIFIEESDGTLRVPTFDEVYAHGGGYRITVTQGSLALTVVKVEPRK